MSSGHQYLKPSRRTYACSVALFHVIARCTFCTRSSWGAIRMLFEPAIQNNPSIQQRKLSSTFTATTLIGMHPFVRPSVERSYCLASILPICQYHTRRFLWGCPWWYCQRNLWSNDSFRSCLFACFLLSLVFARFKRRVRCDLLVHYVRVWTLCTRKVSFNETLV